MRELMLGLSVTPSIGWKTVERLLNLEITPECLSFSESEWKTNFPFLKQEQALLLSQECTSDRIKSLQDELKEKEIEYISIHDPSYPTMLKEIYEAPWILYAKGDLSLLRKPCLGVVGSRKTTPYGRAVTQKLIPDLVTNGWSIISGMATGIDAISHDTTLKAYGSTVAVLGSGLDVIYPKQNKSLYHRIIEHGLVLSEYPPGTAPIPAYFPKRNRIISGLSYGVIVVEAAKDSGSLITANLALEQGREVFAVPGGIFDYQSVGTNLLIQQHGAKLVTNTQDIFVEFSHLNLRPKEETIDQQRLNKGIMVEDIEKEILELLKLEKKHMNELLTESNLPMSDITHTLLKLEMKHLIKALPGAYYQRIDLPS